MKIVFVSNYFNHHQKSVSDRLEELCRKAGGSYLFVQTEAMEEERIRMGWKEVVQDTTYLINYYENPSLYQKVIDDADAVIFGGTDEESYIQNRLKTGKPIWRYSERLYKTGRYKVISPRGLCRKFLDHTRYVGRRVYLLCAGAYVAGDFRMVLAYFGKKYKFGYFPEYKSYDIETLLTQKAYPRTGVTTLFWAARMIEWKHPEVPLWLAAQLKEAGFTFKLLMAGGGKLEEQMHVYAKELGVEGVVTFLGNQNPDRVRRHMEESDIYLATSDHGEGWGAVINEAMNSACVVVANKAMGAAPYLIEHGVNGYLYKNGDKQALFIQVKKLMENFEHGQQVGRRAYETITEAWNPKLAAERLYECIEAEFSGRQIPKYENGPLSRA